MAEFSIGGAGISGLIAAINLAKKDHKVTIHERRSKIGDKPQTYQGLMYPPEIKDPNWMNNYLKKHDIKLDFNYQILKDEQIILDNGKQIRIKHSLPWYLVARGGNKSLEYSLYKQAKKQGVKFKFNSDARKKPMDIMATGTSRTDMIATGGVYKNANFSRKDFLVMFDDKYSPRGWYLYVLPHGKKRIEVMNCVSRQYGHKLKEKYEKAVSEHPRINQILDGAEKLYTVGGRGNCYLPQTCKKGNTLFVGEAAGFQDPFMGFGILLAIESGFLAAQALHNSLDYDKLWKSKLIPKMKQSFSRRFFTSIFGSKIITLVLNNVSGVNDLEPEIENSLLTEIFYRLQVWRTRKRYK